MSHKDYIAIATIIANSTEHDDISINKLALVEALADYFTSDNGLFNTVKFIKACSRQGR